MYDTFDTKVNLEVENGTLLDTEGGSSALIGEELKASNGYAHAVDGVLFPPNVLSLANSSNSEGGSFEGVFDIFLSAVERSGLEAKLSGLDGLYTVCMFVCMYLRAHDVYRCMCVIRTIEHKEIVFLLLFSLGMDVLPSYHVCIYRYVLHTYDQAHGFLVFLFLC